MEDKQNSLAPFLINGQPESFTTVKYLDLEWNNFNVDVMNKNGTKNKTILRECTGYVKHGQMLSIMGPSGKLQFETFS